MIENLALHIQSIKSLKLIDNVTMGKIAEAFDQVGGGIQYELPANIKQLIKEGYLKEIK